MKRPSYQWYPGDWRKDAGVQSCSVAARGLWREMLDIAHDCEPYGELRVNGAPMTVEQIARLAGVAPRECKALLAELEQNGVPSRTDDGAIYSRRMVRDEQVRASRAAGGEAGKEHGIKGAEHGAKGGRPRKIRGDEKPPSKPAPSSSSSSSASASAAQPDRLVAVGERACEAAGLDPGRMAVDFTAVARWLAAGYDPDLDILPAIRAVASRPGFEARSLGYFDRAIAEAHRKRLTPVPIRPQQPGQQPAKPAAKGIAIGSPEDIAERRAMGLEP